MIVLNNLSKAYGKNLVLKDISTALDAGVHGIVGENGAGKTTLFRCIAGLEKYEGSVNPATKTLKHTLGFLTTRPWFFSRMTGREYVRLVCQARGTIVPDIDHRNVFDLPLDQYANTYSTGMKKKLALFAILLLKNQYYILDEPFNGVDLPSNILIVDIIKHLKRKGKVVLVSSHIFSSLTQICDTISLLRDGQIAARAQQSEFAVLESSMTNKTLADVLDRLEIQ